MAEEGTTVLTGDAQAAARGELHGDIHANTAARDAALVAQSYDGVSIKEVPELTNVFVPGEVLPREYDPEADTIDTPEAAA